MALAIASKVAPSETQLLQMIQEPGQNRSKHI